MKKHLIWLACLFIVQTTAYSQTKIDFREFTLDNGLKVIMHKDNKTPIVVTSVMYHVGSKNEDRNVQVLLISLSTYYLKGQKILIGVNIPIS